MIINYRIRLHVTTSDSHCIKISDCIFYYFDMCFQRDLEECSFALMINATLYSGSAASLRSPISKHSAHRGISLLRRPARIAPHCFLAMPHTMPSGATLRKHKWGGGLCKNHGNRILQRENQKLRYQKKIWLQAWSPRTYPQMPLRVKTSPPGWGETPPRRRGRPVKVHRCS
jgi:hypothetical protein